MLSILMIIGAAILRLLPHLPNFTPIGATALFGGVYLKKKQAIIIPLTAMAISDYLLLYINPFTMQIDFSHIYPITAAYHAGLPYVWTSFILTGVLGIWLRSHKSLQNVILASFTSSVLFFLITNFGVWTGSLYSHTLSGLIECYVMALPFFQWTVIGDLIYTALFFGAYEYALRIRNNEGLSIRNELRFKKTV